MIHTSIHGRKLLPVALLLALLLPALVACSGSSGSNKGNRQKSTLTSEPCVYHRFTQPCDYGPDGKLYKLK